MENKNPPPQYPPFLAGKHIPTLGLLECCHLFAQTVSCLSTTQHYMGNIASCKTGQVIISPALQLVENHCQRHNGPLSWQWSTWQQTWSYLIVCKNLHFPTRWHCLAVWVIRVMVSSQPMTPLCLWQCFFDCVIGRKWYEYLPRRRSNCLFRCFCLCAMTMRWFGVGSTRLLTSTEKTIKESLSWKWLMPTPEPPLLIKQENMEREKLISFYLVPFKEHWNDPNVIQLSQL